MTSLARFAIGRPGDVFFSPRKPSEDIDTTGSVTVIHLLQLRSHHSLESVLCQQLILNARRWNNRKVVKFAEFIFKRIFFTFTAIAAVAAKTRHRLRAQIHSEVLTVFC